MLSIFRIGAGKSAPPRAEKGKATAAEKTEIPKDAASLCECLGNASKETTKIIYDVLKSLIMLFIYMIIGVFAYHEIEKDQQWTYIDAAYFSMATMSTVGYGDISPTPGASRGFTIFMIFFGIVFVFSSVANAIGSLTGPITYKGRQFMEYLMPQIPVDLDGDGGVDYYKPRPPLIYYSKNLLPSILLNMALQLVSAAIFCSLNTSWSFGDAFYHCLVTATTVGYGDTNNSTQGGRLWACFHIMLSVCLLGELISTFDELATRRKATLERVRCLERVLDDELLDQLMTRAKIMRPLVIRDGKGLTELEFVLAMIVELGVVEWSQVQPFIKQFRSLDVNGDARLGKDDLALMRGKTRAEINEMVKAVPEVPMSVGARMGVTFRRGSVDAAAPGPDFSDVTKYPLDSLSVDQLQQLSKLVDKQLELKGAADTSVIDASLVEVRVVASA